MTDWYIPRQYLLVFTQRGGSTYLAHCLDSHPDIGAERGEPLHPAHIWHQVLQGVPPHAILRMILGRPGYRATVARVSYRHVRGIDPYYVRELDGLIHLHRENVLRIIVSAMINTSEARPVHTYEALAPCQVRIDTDVLLDECERYSYNVAWMQGYMEGLGPPVLWLTYDQIVGGEGNEAGAIPKHVAWEICDFLGVPRQSLTCDLKRTNPEPLATLIENWAEVKAALTGTEWEKWIE